MILFFFYQAVIVLFISPFEYLGRMTSCYCQSRNLPTSTNRTSLYYCTISNCHLPNYNIIPYPYIISNCNIFGYKCIIIWYCFTIIIIMKTRNYLNVLPGMKVIFNNKLSISRYCYSVKITIITPNVFRLKTHL